MPPYPARLPVPEAAIFASSAPALQARALEVAPVPVSADPASSRPPALPSQNPDAGVVEAEPARSPAPTAAPSKLSLRHGGGAAFRTLVARLAASPFLSLFGRHRPMTPTLSRRIEPALATSAEPPRAASPVPPVPQQTGARRTDAAGTETVPVLALLPLTGPAGLPGIVAAFAREPDGALAQAATEVHATLRAAFADAAPDAPMTVLVTPLRDPSNRDAESVALSLALAAAGAGRRVLLVGARSDDRLRRTLVPSEVPLCLLEREGSLRPLYRLAAAGRTVALLPDDPEAVEVFRSGSTPEAAGIQRRRGSSGFDTVVVVGTGVEADAGSPDCGAHLILIAAPQGTAAADFRAASRRLRRAGDRPCGALLVPAAPSLAPIPFEPATATPEMPAVVGEPSRSPRRVAPVPTGQRRSFDATRRRRSA